MAALTQDESKLISRAVFEKLSSRDPMLEKEAIDAVNDFTRTKMREDGFYRRIMPPIPITNDELDRQVDTDKPVKIVDKEPDSPAAISIPFATLPTNLYIRGPRYRVMFDRIVTPRFTKDVDELRTWIMDIRQVLSDNSIKDMLAVEDSKFLRAVKLQQRQWCCCGDTTSCWRPTVHVLLLLRHREAAQGFRPLHKGLLQ